MGADFMSEIRIAALQPLLPHEMGPMDRLKKQLGVVNLKGFGLSDNAPEVPSAGAILEYIEDTCKSFLGHIKRINLYKENEYVGLDESTQRNLELVQNLQDQIKELDQHNWSELEAE